MSNLINFNIAFNTLLNYNDIVDQIQLILSCIGQACSNILFLKYINIFKRKEKVMNTKEEIFKRRWIILFSVVLVTFMCCLDASIVNVALPVISKDLNVSMASVQWTVTTYLLVISGLILTFGRLGDLKGKSKVFRIGIIIFTIGSLLCGISNTITFLIISRAIQGLGAACTMSASQGIITAIFEPKERGKALGISGLVVALGTMVGPALGGIISQFAWEYIFLINIPIGIVAVILAYKVLPSMEGKAPKDEKLDFIGSGLLLVTIVSAILSITEGSIYGYTNEKIVIGYIVAIIGFVLFMISQKKIKSPILDFSIFSNHRFSKGVITSFLVFIAISAYSILLPFYYEEVRGISPGVSGLLMMVFPIVISIVAPLSGNLAEKIRRDKLPVIGLFLCAIGFFLISTINMHTPIYLILIYLAIAGAGNGLTQAPMNTIVMSSVKHNKLGIAGSMNGLVRNLGMICGITFGTSLLYELMSHKLGYTVKGFVPGKGAVFVSSMDVVNLLSAILCVIAMCTALSIMLKINKEKKAEMSK